MVLQAMTIILTSCSTRKSEIWHAKFVMVLGLLLPYGVLAVSPK